MNDDRERRWLLFKYWCWQWRPFLLLPVYPIAVLTFAILLQEVLPYITPQKPWPDWACLLVALGVMLGLIVCTDRNR